MKKNSVNIITALAICAGLSCTAINADAQTTTPRSSSSSKGTTGTTNRGTSANRSVDKMNKMDAETFGLKAMEGNTAEVSLGKLAQEKGSSAKVKEYAQMMIDEHSQANEQLRGIISGVAMGNSSDQMGTMGNKSQSGTSGTMDSGNTSSSGTTNGTMSSGTATGTASGTMGSSSTTTGSMGAGNTGTTTNGDVPGTAPTRSGTTGINNPSSATAGTIDRDNVDNRTDKTGSDSGLGTTASPTAGSRMGQTDNMGDHSPGDGSDYFDDSKLSPEHRAMKEKLQTLSGAAFDREYITGQIKDHDRTIALYESYANNGDDSRLKEYARTLLPSIRKHRQMATEISNGVMGGKSRTSGSGTNN